MTAGGFVHLHVICQTVSINFFSSKTIIRREKVKEFRLLTCKMFRQNLTFSQTLLQQAEQYNLQVFTFFVIEVHIPEHTRSLSGSLLGYKTIP